LEAAYVICQADRIAASGVWSCAFATAILASHAMVDAADETGTNETISLSTLQTTLPCVMLGLTLYFGVRSWRRFKNFPDETLAAISGLLLILGMDLLTPIRFAALRQEFGAQPSYNSYIWMEQTISQILSMLIVLWIPLRSRTAGLLLLTSIAIVYWSNGLDLPVVLMSIAGILLYGGTCKSEHLSRLAFMSLQQQKELTNLVQQKEANAKSNMALARSLQSLAGRRCDLVVILDANLAVWRPTPLQDMFFKQDMQVVLLPDLLPVSEQEMFFSLVRRVSQHKSVEAMALTLPQGRAKVILEYAGCEEDRFVMSILLDENADQVFNLDDPRMLSIGGWKLGENDTARLSGKAMSQAGSLRDDDSLCYSASEDPTRSSKKSLDFISDTTASVIQKLKPPMVDREVQVIEGDLEAMPPSSGIWSGRPPPLPLGMVKPRSCGSSQSSSYSQQGRSRSCSKSSSRAHSPKLPLNRVSPKGEDHDLMPNLPLMRLTAPLYQPTSKPCMETSMLWLLQHWNFRYVTSHCCPRHAAIAVAMRLIKSHKKDVCNPLWSPFTGWQCEFCSAMNHQQSAICDLCGSSRPEHPDLVHEAASRSLDSKDGSDDRDSHFVGLLEDGCQTNGPKDHFCQL